MSGAQDQAAKAPAPAAEENPGLVAKVKDSLNFTKYLGFVSDLDSPANQRALEAVQENREKDKADGVPEVLSEKPPLSERLKEGVGNVANTAMEASAVAGGGMAPPGESPKEEAEDWTGIGKETESGVKSPGVGTQEPLGAAAPTDESGSKGTGHKILGALGGGNKTSNPEEEGGVSDAKAFAGWAAGAYKKMGHAVASKDIDISKD